MASLSLAVISQELKFNDMSPVSQKMLRIVMNKSILYAGLALTSSFGIERALLGLTQVAIFLLVYISQFLTNRRVSNQIENNYGASWQGVLKYGGVSLLTFLSVGVVTFNMLANLVGGGSMSAQTLVWALDAWTLLLLSASGMSMYAARGLAVLWTVGVRIKGQTSTTTGLVLVPRTNKDAVSKDAPRSGRTGARLRKFPLPGSIVVKRKLTAEVAFYTELHGLIDAVLELGMYWSSCMAYAVVYLFRDGVFVHVFDLAILLDLRYLIAHSKWRMTRWRVLHSRAQYVVGTLAREVVQNKTERERESEREGCYGQGDEQHDGDGYGDGDKQQGDCRHLGHLGHLDHLDHLDHLGHLGHQNRQHHHREECAICMEGIGVGRRLPCGHIFHLRCLLAWIKECDGSKCTCPLCRSDLMGGAEEGERVDGLVVCGRRLAMDDDDDDDDDDFFNDTLWFQAVSPVELGGPDLL